MKHYKSLLIIINHYKSWKITEHWIPWISVNPLINMPCWSIHQPMSSATEDHRASITGRTQVWWTFGDLQVCPGVLAFVFWGEFSPRPCVFSVFFNVRMLPEKQYQECQSNFWVGSLGSWWSISAIRCFRERESSPLVTRPVFEDEDLDGSGTCRKSVLESWLKSHGKRRGSLLVPKGSFWIQILWSFGGPGFAMNLLIDVSAYMFL